MVKKAGRGRRLWRYALWGWCNLCGLGGMVAVQAQQPVYWAADFENGWSDWAGQTSAFVWEDGMARTDGTEAKAALCLMRPVWGDPAQPFDSVGQAAFWAQAQRDGLCWQGRFWTGFNPSSTNYFRYYIWLSGWAGGDTLWADSAVQALYFQMGEKGSENRWQLYRQRGTEQMLLWSGESVYKKSSGATYELRWRVAGTDDDGAGEAAVWVRPPDSLRWQAEGGALALDWADFVPDSLRRRPLYTGFYAYYSTASRATKFGVADMRLGGGAPDPEPEPPVTDTLPTVVAPDPPTDTLPPPVDTLPTVDTLPAPPTEPAPPEPAWQRPPAPAAWLWSEILFDVESGESKFVEFYNASDTVLSPYYLYVGVVSGDEAVGAAEGGGGAKVKWSRLCKDTSLTVPPGGYAAWCKDAESLSPRYTPCTEQVYTASAFPTLNASGGRLLWAWLSPADTVYGEEAVYDKGMHHVLLSSVKGVSLERIGFKVAATRADNWQSASMAEGGATPGCPNSQYNGDLEAEECALGRYFEFSTRLITPNGDGVNDYTEISWNEALQGFVCKAELYDAYGRKMKRLAEDEILSARGRWIYKGEDDKGLSLRAGVYVWLFRLVHPDGRRKTVRYAFAVG